MLHALIQTESSWRPYAIGVVGGRLQRQPTSRGEAILTAQALLAVGHDISLGLAQINSRNLARHGATLQTVFEPCRNVAIGAAILRDCLARAQQAATARLPVAAVRVASVTTRVSAFPTPARTGSVDAVWQAALSCYYSGNFVRGLQADGAGGSSYVARVLANAAAPVRPIPLVEASGVHSRGAGATASAGSRAPNVGLARNGRYSRDAADGAGAPAWLWRADSPVALTVDAGIASLVRGSAAAGPSPASGVPTVAAPARVPFPERGFVQIVAADSWPQPGPPAGHEARSGDASRP